MPSPSALISNLTSHSHAPASTSAPPFTRLFRPPHTSWTSASSVDVGLTLPTTAVVQWVVGVVFAPTFDFGAEVAAPEVRALDPTNFLLGTATGKAAC